MSRVFAYDVGEYGATRAWKADVEEENQWIRVDLLQVYLIQKIATRVRQNNHRPHITTYKVAHSLDDHTEHVYLTSDGSEKIFRGNVHSDDFAVNILNATEARFVKIIVLTWYHALSTQWEVYACLPGSNRGLISRHLLLMHA